MKKFWDFLFDCFVACAISAAVGLIISSFVAFVFSWLSPFGQWNWQQTTFLVGWLAIFLVVLMVIVIATVIENRQEKYADNE